MNILVCVKAVPVTAQVETDGQFRLRRDGVKLQWNIADESALEAALQLKGPEGSVTVLTMGPGKLEDSLRELLARSVDHAVLLTDPTLAGADTYATAKALAAAVKKLGGFDLILCGSQAMDGETGQVPGMLSAALELPCVTAAEDLQQDQNRLRLTRRTEQDITTLSVSLPAVVSLRVYAYTLRLPGILGMRRAKQAQVQRLSADDLGLDPKDCGLKGSLTTVVNTQSQYPGLRSCVKETDPKLSAKNLLALCKEVAK